MGTFAVITAGNLLHPEPDANVCPTEARHIRPAMGDYLDKEARLNAVLRLELGGELVKDSDEAGADDLPLLLRIADALRGIDSVLK